MTDSRQASVLGRRFPAALLAAAVAAALFAVIFRLTLAWVYDAFYGARDVVHAFLALPAWARLAVPIGGACLAGLVTRFTGRGSQGVSNVMEAVALGRIHLSLPATLARVASSWTAIAAGASIGREGPLIEFGGAIGAAVGQETGLPVNGTRVLVASGTAAGFAAAYNTPFAASLFVLETIAGIASPVLLLPVLAATAIATGLTRAFVGAGPIYGQRAFTEGTLVDLLWFAALGLVAALTAIVFKWTLNACERGCARLRLPQPYRAVIGGAAVGLAAVGLPQVVGNGYEPVNEILNGTALTYSIALLVVAKIVVTSMTVGSGIPGGVFTPMLLVGASVGHVFGQGLLSAGVIRILAPLPSSAWRRQLRQVSTRP